MLEYIDCPHCGRQNVVLVPADRTGRCSFCNQRMGRKDGDMTSGKAAAHVEDLPKNVREKLMEQVPPAPSKPDISNLSVRKRGDALHNYYEEHKDEIISDFESFGQKYMMQRWGICYATWGTQRVYGMKHRWMPDRFPFSGFGDKRPKRKRL